MTSDVWFEVWAAYDKDDLDDGLAEFVSHEYYSKSDAILEAKRLKEKYPVVAIRRYEMISSEVKR